MPCSPLSPLTANHVHLMLSSFYSGRVVDGVTQPPSPLISLLVVCSGDEMSSTR